MLSVTASKGVTQTSQPLPTSEQEKVLQTIIALNSLFLRTRLENYIPNATAMTARLFTGAEIPNLHERIQVHFESCLQLMITTYETECKKGLSNKQIEENVEKTFKKFENEDGTAFHSELLAEQRDMLIEGKKRELAALGVVCNNLPMSFNLRIKEHEEKYAALLLNINSQASEGHLSDKEREDLVAVTKYGWKKDDAEFNEKFLNDLRGNPKLVSCLTKEARHQKFNDAMDFISKKVEADRNMETFFSSEVLNTAQRKKRPRNKNGPAAITNYARRLQCASGYHKNQQAQRWEHLVDPLAVREFEDRSKSERASVNLYASKSEDEIRKEIDDRCFPGVENILSDANARSKYTYLTEEGCLMFVRRSWRDEKREEDWGILYLRIEKAQKMIYDCHFVSEEALSNGEELLKNPQPAVTPSKKVEKVKGSYAYEIDTSGEIKIKYIDSPLTALTVVPLNGVSLESLKV